MIKKALIGLLLAIFLARGVSVPVLAADPTETLRPNAAGDETTVEDQFPDSGSHWEKVDEASPDDDTYVYGFTGRDLYNLPASSGSGTINFIKVYFRARDVYGTNTIKPSIKSDGIVTDGIGIDPSDTYATYSQQWNTNPADHQAWEWSDIDALQIGIWLAGLQTIVYCTQVYVVVDHSPASPTVTTQAVTDIFSTTATGHGEVTDIGDANCTKRGVVYDTGSHGDPGNTAPVDSGYANYEEDSPGPFGAVAFTRDLTGLDPGQTYYVRAYAYNEYGYGYGGETSFITDLIAPSIDSEAATYVAQTTAQLNSTVTDDGGEPCDVRFGYGDETQVAGNVAFELYDTKTEWVLDEYETGEHPFFEADGLTLNDDYFYRVQIKNSEGTLVPSADEIEFHTETDFAAPTNLKAYPTDTTVGLTWTKNAGATYTMIRYSETDYPADRTEGTFAVLTIQANYTITGLTPGETYYIVAISRSGAEYAVPPTEVMATTTAGAPPEEGPSESPMPTTWFQSPNYANLSDLPGFDQINAFFDAFEFPRASGWFLSAILGCIFSAILIYAISRQPTIALVALGLFLAIASLIKLLPLYMMAFTVVFIIGAFKIRGAGEMG